jgi:hypothetical protein
MKARTSNYPTCRHTKTDGLLCQSPASGTSAYCHFHKRLGRNRLSTVGSGPALREHVLYPLRDAHSIRQALSMVLSGLMSGQIPTAQAGKMLFALQIASMDLRKSPEQ